MKIKNEVLKLDSGQLDEIIEKHQVIENPVERMEEIWKGMELDTYSASKSIILYLNDTGTDLGVSYAMQASLALLTDGFIEWDQYIDADNNDYLTSLKENYLSGDLH